MAPIRPIFEVPGQFWLAWSYSIPTPRMLRDYRFGWLGRPLRALANWLPAHFRRSSLSSRRFTRGGIPRATSQVHWRELAAAVVRNGGDATMLVGQQLHAFLCPGIFEDRTVRFERPRDGKLVYHYICSNPSGGGIYARRVLDLEVGEAYHDLLFAHPAVPGVKIADIFMAAATEYYDKIGIRRIALQAGLSGGGRLWPKYGFHPVNTDEWRQCRPIILKNLAALGEGVPARRRNAILALLAKPDPRTIWEVSAFDQPVPGTGHKLGDVLLSGTKWRGILNLDDTVARGRLRARLDPGSLHA
jgi:GNAT superfamily N-acetyltransferase